MVRGWREKGCWREGGKRGGRGKGDREVLEWAMSGHCIAGKELDLHGAKGWWCGRPECGQACWGGMELSWTCMVGGGEGAGRGVEAAGRQWALRHKEEGWEGGGKGGGKGASAGQCVSRYSPLLPPCSPLLTAALCCCAATLCADVPPGPPDSCAAWLLVLASSQPGAWLQRPVSTAAAPGMARAVGVADKCEWQWRHHNAMQQRWVQAGELVW